MSDERDWFCPECGVRDAHNHGIDDDGTCSSCGSGCCRMSHCRALLADHGLALVPAADVDPRDKLRRKLELALASLRAAISDAQSTAKQLERIVEDIT